MNSINNVRTLRRLEDEHPLSNCDLPTISILIPARNEEQNLPRCLESLVGQRYPRFTVTVLDDQSTDRTTEVVQDVARRDSRVRLINGTPPPVGWAGKPWACQQLGMRADGDILLFLEPIPGSIPRPFDTRRLPIEVTLTVDT